jgi:hypothetical protein
MIAQDKGFPLMSLFRPGDLTETLTTRQIAFLLGSTRPRVHQIPTSDVSSLLTELELPGRIHRPARCMKSGSGARNAEAKCRMVRLDTKWDKASPFAQ